MHAQKHRGEGAEQEKDKSCWDEFAGSKLITDRARVKFVCMSRRIGSGFHEYVMAE